MQSILIQGYKSIKNLDLPLRSINILIGSNGSGKSNFLSFFEFLRNIYDRNLREYVGLRGGVNKFLHKGEKITEEISCKLSFKNTNAYSFTIKSGEEGFVFTTEGLWYTKNPYAANMIEIASYNSEATLKFASPPRAEYITAYLDGLAKYHFHDTGSNSPFNKESHIVIDSHFLYDKGQNLAAFLYSIFINNKPVYAIIIKTIQSIAPYFSDFYFAPNQNGYIKLLWQNKHSSTLYGTTDLSDGTIRFIALTALFMQPILPETIIIDEPELGLHPAAIAKLAGMIKSASAKECQVILATQSTDLISHFIPEDIITVDQTEGESVFKRLDSESLKSWLEDYTIDDLWKRNIITTGQPNK